MTGNNLANQNNDAGRPRAHRQRRISVVAAVWAALLGTTLLSACDGDNLFSGDSRSLQPRITEVAAPAEAAPGDSIEVVVGAIAPRNVGSVDIVVSGGMAFDTTIVPGGELKSFSQAVVVGLPNVLSDTLIIISATVTDAVGAVSRPVADTLVVIGPPGVVSIDGPETSSLGSTITLAINARGDRPVDQLSISATGAIARDTTVTVAPAARTVTRNVQFMIPSTAQDTVIDFVVFARDQTGRVSAPATHRILLAVGGPRVTEVTTVPADSIQAGRTLDLRITAEGQRPLTELRVRYRGATEEDQSLSITPARTLATEETSITLPLEVRDTLLTISVTAVDAAASLSPVFSTTIRVRDITAPTVSATLTQTTASVGSSIDVRLSARDNIGLARYGIFALNASGDTIVGQNLQQTAGLQRDTTFRFTIPANLLPQTLRVFGVAVDVQGLRSISTAASLTVADSSAPAITINAPVGGSTFPLGDSILVRARIVDPTGIREVRMRGEAIRTDSLSDTEVVTRYNERVITFPQAPQTTLPTDTTIVRYLTATPDTASEDVQIVVEATDSLGNEAQRVVTVSVGGPRVELRTPASGSQVQIGGTLVVEAFAVDRANGIDSMKVFVTGAQTQTFAWYDTSPDSIKRDTSFVIGAATGTLNIEARAWSEGGEGVTATPVTVTIVSTQVTDTQAPQVGFSVSNNTRVELDDSITITVTGADQGSAGMERMGVIVIAEPNGTPVRIDTLMIDSVYPQSRTGQFSDPFHIRLADFIPFQEDSLTLPRQFTLRIHAFAIDTMGNIGTNTATALAANPGTRVTVGPTNVIPVDTAGYVRTGSNGFQHTVTAVSGESENLPRPGTIADVVYDSLNYRLYLSNQSVNGIEVMNLASDTFYTAPIAVGSEPWGLFVAKSTNPLLPDTLMVGNSGGTNISFVPLDQGANADLDEEASRRILTPNAVLFTITSEIAQGVLRYTVTPYDFSDRPQFVAQDTNRVILYSTKPTGAAPDGTIRYAFVPPGTTLPEVRLLYTRSAINATAEAVSLAHLDSIQVTRPLNTSDRLTLWDHIPGTNTLISSVETTDLDAAVADIQAKGSDVADEPGAWIPEDVGLSDTTFMAVSGNQRVVGFGEAGVDDIAETGRIWLWTAATSPVPADSGQITDEISVADLVNNASERVLGIGLDELGELGVARGEQAAYYFSNDVQQSGDLRLQGVFSDGVGGGNGGAALHPQHRYTPLPGTNTLSFIATADRSIKVVDTFHFFEYGEVPIRDNVVGQLRAAMPIAGENGTLASNDPNFIVVKVFGVTDTGAVVVVPIRRKDIPTWSP